MEIRQLRCSKCRKLLMNRLSGDIIFDDSTNRLSLVPGADDVILEIKCLRCGRFSVILKQIGSDNSEYADE